MNKLERRSPVSPKKPKKWFGRIAVVSVIVMAYHSPSHADLLNKSDFTGDITNFKVKNCTQQRIFVCSYDKTDSLMKIPYKAAGVQPDKKKKFGCASIGKCKVIIGVSKKRSKSTLSGGMQAALAGGVSGGGVVVSLVAAEIYLATYTTTMGAGLAVTSLVSVGALAAVSAVAVGGAIAALEISDGWSDGKVCNEVKRVARAKNLKPKHYLHNGNNYRVTAGYAVDSNGNFYVNPDGTAIYSYETAKGKTCPNALEPQIVPNR